MADDNLGNPIIRVPTNDERKDFVPLVDPLKRGKTAKEKFYDELGKQILEANKKGLPYAERAVKDEFNDYYDKEIKLNIRKNGFLRQEEIKPFKPDWNKYCDLKNFEVVEEGEKSDEHLTRVNPGLQVNVKFTTYKFKGYTNKYTVMESAPSAINRAKKARE